MFTANAYRCGPPATQMREANDALVRRGIDSRFATAVYAVVLVGTASAEKHAVRVTLVTGEVMTMTVEVPSGGPATAASLPALPAAVSSFEDLGQIPVATVTGTSALNRVCSKSLKCYAAGGSVDACWPAMDFDVTASVVASLAWGNLHPSWLIKRQIEDKTGGGFRFFSREGAVCILGIPALRPHLRVVLNGEPPIAPDPPDHCQFSAR